MFNRSSNFAGGIATNRYVFGGLEGAFAVAALTLATAGVSGTAEADPYTYPSAGMVGPYRTIAASSIEAEAAGSGGLSFTAAGVSYTSALDLTYPFAGLISRERGTITISDTTQFEFFLTASLQGLIDPLNEREFELALVSSLSATSTGLLIRNGAGTATLGFAASGRSGAIGAAQMQFAAFGAGVGVGSPFITGAGEAQFSFTAAATGLATWPMSPAGMLQFSAQAFSQAEAIAAGAATLQFGASAAAIQDAAGRGTALMAFAADGNSGFMGYMDGAADLTFIAAGAAGGLLAEGVFEHAEWLSTLEQRPHLSTVTQG